MAALTFGREYDAGADVPQESGNSHQAQNDSFDPQRDSLRNQFGLDTGAKFSQSQMNLFVVL